MNLKPEDAAEAQGGRDRLRRRPGAGRGDRRRVHRRRYRRRALYLRQHLSGFRLRYPHAARRDGRREPCRPTAASRSTATSGPTYPASTPRATSSSASTRSATRWAKAASPRRPSATISVAQQPRWRESTREMRGSRNRQLSCIVFIIHHLLSFGAGGFFMRFLAILAALSCRSRRAARRTRTGRAGGPRIEASLAATWPTAAPPRQAAFSRDGASSRSAMLPARSPFAEPHSWKIRSNAGSPGRRDVGRLHAATERRLVSGGYDGTIRFWDLGTAARTGVIKASLAADLDARSLAGRHAACRGRRRCDHPHLEPRPSGLADCNCAATAATSGKSASARTASASPAAASTTACGCGTSTTGRAAQDADRP